MKKNIKNYRGGHMKNIFTLLVLTLLLVPAQIFAAARDHDSVRRSSVLDTPHDPSRRTLAPSPDQRAQEEMIAREEDTYADTLQEKLLEYSKQGLFGDVATLLDEKSAQRITCKNLKAIVKSIQTHLKALEHENKIEFEESKADIIECLFTIKRTIKTKKVRI